MEQKTPQPRDPAGKAAEITKLEEAETTTSRRLAEIDRLLEIEFSRNELRLKKKLLKQERSEPKKRQLEKEIETLETGLDQAYHPFKWFLVDKIGKKNYAVIFGSDSRTASVINSDVYAENLTGKTCEVIETKKIEDKTDNAVMVSSNGFYIRLKNKKEVTTKDGIEIDHKEAKYDLISPDGTVGVANIAGYEVAERELKKEAKKYQQGQLAVFEKDKSAIAVEAEAEINEDELLQEEKKLKDALRETGEQINKLRTAETPANLAGFMATTHEPVSDRGTSSARKSAPVAKPFETAPSVLPQGPTFGSTDEISVMGKVVDSEEKVPELMDRKEKQLQLLENIKLGALLVDEEDGQVWKLTKLPSQKNPNYFFSNENNLENAIHISKESLREQIEQNQCGLVDERGAYMNRMNIRTIYTSEGVIYEKYYPDGSMESYGTAGIGKGKRYLKTSPEGIEVSFHPETGIVLQTKEKNGTVTRFRDDGTIYNREKPEGDGTVTILFDEDGLPESTMREKELLKKIQIGSVLYDEKGRTCKVEKLPGEGEEYKAYYVISWREDAKKLYTHVEPEEMSKALSDGTLKIFGEGAMDETAREAGEIPAERAESALEKFGLGTLTVRENNGELEYFHGEQPVCSVDSEGKVFIRGGIPPETKEIVLKQIQADAEKTIAETEAEIKKLEAQLAREAGEGVGGGVEGATELDRLLPKLSEGSKKILERERELLKDILEKPSYPDFLRQNTRIKLKILENEPLNYRNTSEKYWRVVSKDKLPESEIKMVISELENLAG